MLLNEISDRSIAWHDTQADKGALREQALRRINAAIAALGDDASAKTVLQWIAKRGGDISGDEQNIINDIVMSELP